MAEKRIIDLTEKTSALGNSDFFAVDNETGGTKKISSKLINKTAFDVAENILGIEENGQYDEISYQYDEENHYLNLSYFPQIEYSTNDDCRTTRISVNPGEKYFISGVYAYNAALYGIVNSENELIEVYPTSRTSRAQGEYRIVTIPDDGVALICGSYSVLPLYLAKINNTDLDINYPGVNNNLGYKKIKTINFEQYLGCENNFPYVMPNSNRLLTAIEVKAGEKYKISGAYDTNSALYAILDSTGTILSRKPTAVSSFTYETVELTMPQNAAYLYVGTVKGQPLIIEKEMAYISNKADVLSGKKWTVCGDSFTVGDFSGYVDPEGHTGEDSDAYDKNEGVYKTYPWWIGQRNDMRLQILAQGGNDFTNITGATRPFSDSNTNFYNYTNIDSDSDYVTFMFGLNESNLTTDQIGTKTDSDNTTLWGAYNVVLESVLTANPTVKIGIIIEDAWMTQTYHDALIDIAKYWGIPYLDLKNGVSVPMGIYGRLDDTSPTAKALRDNAFKVSATNSHPNLKGHEYRSTFIENFLRSL